MLYPIPLRSSVLPAALLASAALLRPATAGACGGMVFPAHEERVGGMSDQELFISFADDETVLVASAGYRGGGSGFAFILPLASEPAEVADGDPSLFVALDQRTAPRVEIYVDDGGSSFGGCVAASDGGGKGNVDMGFDDVMVKQRGRTASYEYVVIGGDTGTAIADWLTAEGYALPPDYADALTPYVADGWYFFAAKVLPEVAQGELKPLELHLPPAQPETFEIPFGLSAHSLPPGEPLGITAYLYAAAPVLPDNYPAAQVDRDALEALSEITTNYTELERAILESDPDGAWLIDHSVDTDASALVAAYGSAIDQGNGGDSPGDPAWLEGFTGRIPATGRLVRIRTELQASQLRDMRLRRSSDASPVYPELSATYDASGGGRGCRLDRSGRLADFLLLVPVLLAIRPRRRRRA